MDYFKKYWEYVVIGTISFLYGIFIIGQGFYLTGALDRFMVKMGSDSSGSVEVVFKAMYGLFAGGGSFLLYIFGFVCIFIGCLLTALSLFVFFRSKIITGVLFVILLMGTYMIVGNIYYSFKIEQIPFVITLGIAYVPYISLVIFKRKKHDKKDKKIEL